MSRTSVALSGDLDASARKHLLRADGQEDVCLATYTPSTGRGRSTAVLRDLVLPRDDERQVHGTVSFQGSYVIRAASLAAADGLGIALLHSHPDGTGWQGMSHIDRATERSYARAAATITGQPLAGLTLAADHTWSARFWDADGEVRHAENVRVVGTRLVVSWNDSLRPATPPTAAQVRTISAWGEPTQASLSRLRVLVVGVGTVGMDIAIRLVQAGITDVSVMDFDTIEEINLDRLLTATRLDAALSRSKTHVALRAMRAATTAARPVLAGHELSICEPQGLQVALDHDVIFSCVDRPWARAVLNQLAFSDLIPVIDGGLAVEPFETGGMRNVTCRTHVVTPGRPCLQCTGQITGAQVARDRAGLLDDQTYIRTSGRAEPARENVSLLAPSVVGPLLGQFVSLTVAPGGRGVPEPLRLSLATHTLEHMTEETQPGCGYEGATARGDGRAELTARHPAAEAARRSRAGRLGSMRSRRLADHLVRRATSLFKIRRRRVPGRRVGRQLRVCAVGSGREQAWDHVWCERTASAVVHGHCRCGSPYCCGW